MFEFYKNIINKLLSLSLSYRYFNLSLFFMRWGADNIKLTASTTERLDYTLPVKVVYNKRFLNALEFMIDKGFPTNLLLSGFNNEDANGNTLLGQAIESNWSIDRLWKLLDRGAIFGDDKDRYSYSLLKRSLKNGDILEYILRYDIADIDAKGTDPEELGYSILDCVMSNYQGVDYFWSPKKDEDKKRMALFILKLLSSEKLHSKLSHESLLPAYNEVGKILMPLILNESAFNYNSPINKSKNATTFIKFFIDKNYITDKKFLDNELLRLICANKIAYDCYRHVFIKKLMNKNIGNFYCMINLSGKVFDHYILGILLRPSTFEEVYEYEVKPFVNKILEFFDKLCNKVLENKSFKSYEILRVLFNKQAKIVEIFEKCGNVLLEDVNRVQSNLNDRYNERRILELSMSYDNYLANKNNIIAKFEQCAEFYLKKQKLEERLDVILLQPCEAIANPQKVVRSDNDKNLLPVLSHDVLENIIEFVGGHEILHGFGIGAPSTSVVDPEISQETTISSTR